MRRRIRRAAAITRSGLKRYPRELLSSLRLRPGGGAGALGEPVLGDVGGGDLGAMWLGHATVLLRLGGRTVLTDPVFSERIGPRVGPLTVGISRLAPVPVGLDRLPPIDLILISHAHFDHLDKPTLRALASERTTVVTAHHTGELIPPGFGRVIELDWGRDVEVDGVQVRAVRPVHWGARTAYDRHRRFNSYLLQSAEHRVLFAGDTALTDAFDRLGRVDLAIFGIGAYDPWIHRHANPEQVWEMFRALGGDFLLPMHHSTFRLGEEGIDEPLERLTVAADRSAEHIVCRSIGEVWGLDLGRLRQPERPGVPLDDGDGAGRNGG